MKNLFLSKKTILVLIPILSLFLGFLFGEDLSTGGATKDFYATLPAVTDFSNLIFNTTHHYTRHFPLHYFILSIPHFIFNDIYAIRIVYLFFSLTLPFFVYLNLCEIYKVSKINNLIISASLLFLPYFRASAIWPNAHLTALIFLVVANFFYIRSVVSSKFIYKFMNIFFLSLSTYCVQSYAIFFLFYLFNYYQNDSKKNFLKIMIICFFFSMLGFYLIINNPFRDGVIGLNFSNNLSYTIITNLSIIFFFIIFYLINKNNFSLMKKYFLNLNIYENLILIFLFYLLVLDYKEIGFFYGGGFFYKMSLFLFQNKLIFFISGFFGFVTFYLFFKNEKKIFYTLVLLNCTSIAYYTSQKYFEPLLIISILIFHQNFLSRNIINDFKNTLTFYTLIFAYYVIATINSIYGLSKLAA